MLRCPTCRRSPLPSAASLVIRWSAPPLSFHTSGKERMPAKDKRVDAYIDQAPDFARPILTRIRETVHEACPECEETLKWGHPLFMYNGIMCGMAAFKEYCAFHFWKGAL